MNLARWICPPKILGCLMRPLTLQMLKVLIGRFVVPAAQGARGQRCMLVKGAFRSKLPSTQSPSGIYFFISHFATLARNIPEIDPLCAYCIEGLFPVNIPVFILAFFP